MEVSTSLLYFQDCFIHRETAVLCVPVVISATAAQCTTEILCADFFVASLCCFFLLELVHLAGDFLGAVSGDGSENSEVELV